MSKTLAPSSISITTRDPKGRKFVSVVEASYNKAGLCDEEAQLVNESPGLAYLVNQFINQHRYPKNSPKEKARIWQEATQKAYGLMGMADAYAGFSKDWKVTDMDGHWTVVMLEGMMHAKIDIAIREAGSGFWSYYNDMDESVVTNDRDPNRDGSYAIAVRSEVEADSENANKSANQLAKEGHKGMTLMERLLLELVYFLATREHLDVKNFTLCTGSRFVRGNVPIVFFHNGNGRVRVSYYGPNYSDELVRSRSVVTASGAQL